MRLEDCDAVRAQVRAFFKAGLKSANKKYFEEDVDLDATFGTSKMGRHKAVANWRINKVQRRNALREKAHVTLSWQRRATGKLPSIDQVEWMIRKSPETRVGNCGEMAALSAYYTANQYNIPYDQLFCGAVHPPGDHAFCLICPVGLPPQAEYPTVARFTGAGQFAVNALVIDPWLNICCRAVEYLQKAGQQLDRWGTVGKRVYWFGADGDKEGWYPPQGEYKTLFAQSPLKLFPYG